MIFGKYEFAYFTWNKKFEGYYKCKGDQVKRIVLSTEILDPSIKFHQYFIKYYEKLETAFDLIVVEY